jgi:serine protease Do
MSTSYQTEQPFILLTEAINPVQTAQATAPNRQMLTIPQIVQAVGHSVVEIATERAVRSGRFGRYIQSGAGSGVIISSDGFIVTNNHVITGANKITIRLKNGMTFEAELIGRDSRTDLAVLKINASNLTPVVFGDSSTLQVGELAVAIGNPLGELGGTVTEGIISALNRDISLSDGTTMNLMQTSAAVNYGNSGGGLFNAYGELIGIVNAKSGGSNIEGIGFAIPGNTVRAITAELSRLGYVEGRIDFGIQLVDVNDWFTAAMNGLPALGVYVARSNDESGLKAGDRIINVAGTDVATSADVKAVYGEYKVGDKLEVIVIRDGKTFKTDVELKQAVNI